MSKIKRIPFDAEKAKKGAKVVTRCGYPVRIGFYDVKNESFPISGAVTEGDNTEVVRTFTKEGRHYAVSEDSDYVLFIEEEEQEKQGEQETLCDKCKKLQPSHSCQDITALGICAVEHEQKTTDKFEIMPDKWYVCTCPYTGKDFLFLLNFPYLGKDILNYLLSKDKDYQDFFRPWTIQDAKPGDVLYSLDSKQPFIFKNRKPHLQASVYCGINIFGKFFVENTEECIITTDKYIPADKFQYEHLFQKMKEAGYVWDSYKKELHKIGKEVKQRLMTKQELSKWLRENPEEFREYKQFGYIASEFTYYISEADIPVNDNILIRQNYGKWQEPLVEE